MPFEPLDHMEDIKALVGWAEAKGVQLGGIQPASLPGRGVGIVAAQKLEVSTSQST